jgi:hypothetical protein
VTTQVELSLAHRLGFASPHFAAYEVLVKSVQPQNVVYLARCVTLGPNSLKSNLMHDYGDMYLKLRTVTQYNKRRRYDVQK